MKILLASEDLPGAQLGGLARHVVTLGNALLGAGHTVDILGRRHASGAAEAGGFDGRMIGAIDLRHPNWKESQLGLFNPLKRPWLARSLARTIAQHAPFYDVVHYHGHLPLVGDWLAPGMRFVQTRHDQGSECLTHLRFRAGAACAEQSARACAACVCAAPGALRQRVSAMAVQAYRDATARAFARHKTVFVSEFLRRRFASVVAHADLANSCVIPNFVDGSAIARQAGAPVHAGLTVVAGRIDAGKGFGPLLAQAHARLPSGARLLVVGDGPERHVLQQRYAGSAVEFAGWRAHADVLALAAAAHVCVVPSLCEEACSTTVLEALALGRPCLALARGGTPELAQYQRYAGQLMLAPDMPTLVERLCALLRETPAPTPGPAPFGADVVAVVNRLLAFYDA